MKIRSLIVISFCLLVGCATTKPKMPIAASFNSEQAQRLLAEGPNTIKGSALMRQVSGGVVSCAGQLMRLIPATDYATERMIKLYGNDTKGYLSAIQVQMNPNPFESNDPAYITMLKQGTCDAQGYFKFEKISDGTFYLQSTITWKANPNSSFFEGGTMIRKVTVSGGQTLEIVIAP